MANNLQPILPALFTGAGGQLMTPDQIKRERDVAQALLGGGIQPVNNWAEGLAGLVDAFNGAARNRRADAADAANAATSQRIMASLLGGGGASGAAPAADLGVPNAPPASAPSIPAGERADYIRQGLLSRGLPEHVADAFIVNFQDESGLNPGINEAAPLVPGSRGGYGLYQLTGPRRTDYEAFAASRGIDPSNVDGQLDWLMHELRGSESAAAKSILSAPDTATAAQAILNDFLRPAPEHRRSRGARYARLGGPVQVASADGSGPSAETMDALMSGVNQARGGQGGTMSVADALAPAPYTPEPFVPPQTGGRMNPAIVQALTSPYVDDQTRAVGQLLFQQQQGAQKAAAAQAFEQYQTREQRAYDQWKSQDERSYEARVRQEGYGREDSRNAVLDARDQRDFDYRAQNDRMTGDIREYEYAKQPGNEGFADFSLQKRRAGAVNVNLPGQPNIGTIPPGYEAVQDQLTGSWTMRPIPGGPAAAEAAKTAQAAENKKGSTERYGNVVLQDIDRALGLINEGGWLPVSGAGSSWAAGIGGTQANDLRTLLDTVKSNVTFDRLQAMRDSSPTGAALGAVSDTELGLLQAAIGSLDQSQSKSQLVRNLARVREITDEIVNGVQEEEPKKGEALEDLLSKYGS